MKNKNPYYIYAHCRACDGKAFYIGKGKGGRAFTTRGRNRWWNEITDSTEWFVKILYKDLSEECAFSIENMLIFLNRENLCNVTETKQKTKTPQYKKGNPVINSKGEIFNSISQAAKAYYDGSNSIENLIYNIRNCAKGKYNNTLGLSWSFNIEKQPEFIPSRRGETKIKCLETGQVFPSLKSAVEWMNGMGLKGNRVELRRACLRLGKSQGYSWRYAQKRKIIKRKNVT